MCLIVDANVASETFNPFPSPEFAPIWEALTKGRATAVWGGRLVNEYLRLRKHVGLIKELERKGVLRRVSDSDVEAKTKELERENSCRSDDPHIIALALVSRVRLLCSLDNDLRADFANPAILRPRGSIYTRAEHRHLIDRHCSKSRPRRRKRRRGRK